MADKNDPNVPKKQLQELDLGTVGALRDGRVGMLFANELQRVLADCDDRPGNTTQRVVVLKLLITPVGSDDDANQCEKVEIETRIHSSTPPHNTKAHQATLRKRSDRSGREKFCAMVGVDPEDSDQLTLGQ